MQEAQVSGVQLLKPGEYPAIVLHLANEAFHQMTLPVPMPVIISGFLAVRAGRNDRGHTQFPDVLAKLPGVVPFVGQYVLASIAGDQTFRLGDVVLLPAGQYESQGVAQAVHAHVNLGAEPAAAPAQGSLTTLLGGAPAAPGCARTTVLSMIRCSISGSSAEMLMHLFPDALVSPTGEPFVDAVPVPVFGWQQSPLGPRAVDP